VANEIIGYLDMCQREGVNLQRGMNYQLGSRYSVVLMSVRPNAPYRDRIEDDGSTLVYEGHDVARSKDGPDPKETDQPEFTPSGSLTQNGLFHRAAQDAKKGLREPELVRVYEKIRQGIWSYNGVFHLVDSWQESDGRRQVFKFRMLAAEEEVEANQTGTPLLQPRRLIPTHVKLEVWKRDHGQCVRCGATDELHFDHIIPFSKGGTSLTADNVQLLCARHNLEKSDGLG
jgi:hypothetical protein